MEVTKPDATRHYLVEMGAYLSTPNREKHSVDYAGGECSYGASSMQGWRISQEVMLRSSWCDCTDAVLQCYECLA